MTGDTDVQPGGTRQRLLDAAQRCFYRDGITATGVDALAAEAGVSKRTLYKHFGSKQGLVTAYLERREAYWRERQDRWVDEADTDPVEQIVALARAYGERLPGEEFRGCAFINAAAELADEDHPALGVIRGSLSHVEHRVESILRGAGIASAKTLATHVLLILEGAISVAGIRRADAAFRAAEQAIRALLGAHSER